MKTTDFVDTLNKGPGGVIMIYPGTLASKIDEFLGDRKPVTDDYDVSRLDFHELGLPDGSSVTLELGETKFFRVLYKYRGCLVRHQKIDHAMLNPNHAYSTFSDGKPKILDIYVHKLRKKLGHDAIKTIWGEGWSLI